MTSVFPREPAQPGARLGLCQTSSLVLGQVCTRHLWLRWNNLHLHTPSLSRGYIFSQFIPSPIRYKARFQCQRWFCRQARPGGQSLDARLDSSGQKKDISRSGCDGVGMVASRAGERRPALAKSLHPHPLHILSLPGLFRDFLVDPL